MNSNNTVGGPGTTPEDIALAAGMPRGSSASHSLHAAGDHKQPEALSTLANAQVHSTAGSGRDSAAKASNEAAGSADRLKDKAGDIASQASDAFNSAKDTAFSAAADAHDRLGKTADDYRGRASTAYEDARNWAADQHDTHRRRLGEVSDKGTERLRQGKNSVEDFVSDNPLLVGVVGVAAGLLLGALLPRTRREDQAVGPWADEMRDQGLRYARDLTSKGREFVETALDPDAINAAAKRATEQSDAPAGAGRSRPH